jgi:hypothetical protein
MRPSVVSYKQLKFLIVATVAFGLAGCATVVPPTLVPELPVPKWELDKMVESITQRHEQFRSVRTLAKVDYAGPEGKHGFQEAVLVQRPDRLRLETLSYLGAILIVTANPKEIIGYHPREGVFVRGARTKENMLRYTQIPLELDEITSLLIGLPPVGASTPKQEGNTLIYSSNGHKKDAVTFESQQAVPTKWERFNANGAVEISARFSDYISTSAGPFPSKITIEAHLQKKKVELRYQEPELNATLPSDLFTQQKPAHAQELPIEAIGN